MQKAKKYASWLTAVTLTLGLGACSAVAEDSFAECKPLLSKGALASNTSVLGGFGTDPVVSIPDGFSVGGAQRALIEQASGNVSRTTEPTIMTVNYALIASEGNTIVEQSESFTAGAGHDFLPVSHVTGQGAFLDGLACAAAGDRVLIVFDAEEATSIAGSLGAPEGTNFVALVDVHHVQKVTPAGAQNIMPSGFPGVVTDETGQPGVVIAPAKAPTSSKQATRILGDGPVVAPNHAVVANVLKVSWFGDLQENSWGEGGPRYLGTNESPTSDVRALLNGAKVGSQMVYLEPAGEGQADIYVVDILAAG